MLKELTDYSGRRRDISILDYPDLSSMDGKEVFPRFGKTSRFCAGTQKLIQRYTVLMLTNVNSQEFYPTFGTDFLWPLQAGISPTSRLQAAQIFFLADYDTVTVIKNYQVDNPDLPEDEQLDYTELVDFVLYNGSVAFSVKLTTLAGNLSNFLIPLPKQL
jgi:hypothetical protein